PDESFSFGLADREHDEYQSMVGLYILTLRKMGRLMGLGRSKKAPPRRVLPPSPLGVEPARQGRTT
ncbi:MAG: hypothetical protein M3Y41_16045, partial [Pseudomonadota bacterium]|nr:hypothetical protein [Pseudomonadota bacterium]